MYTTIWYSVCFKSSHILVYSIYLSFTRYAGSVENIKSFSQRYDDEVDAKMVSLNEEFYPVFDPVVF